jgi:hypothetical protein
VVRVEGRIESLVQTLETYIATHEGTHAHLAEMVKVAKERVDRDLHVLNNLDAQMDRERNLLASKESVIDMERTIDRRVMEFQATIEKRMTEIERQAGVSAGSLSGRAVQNAAWVTGILLAIALLGFLLKYIFDM